MSARGWAGAVRMAASQYEQSATRYRRDGVRDTAAEHDKLAAALRELAALLDRITPERVERGIHYAGRESDTNWQLCRDALRKLARGPAEQQETGR